MPPLKSVENKRSNDLTQAGAMQSHRCVLQYPWRGARLGWLANALAVSAGLFVGIYGLGRYLISSVSGDLAADPSALPLYLTLTAFFGLCFGICVFVVIDFAREFELNEDGLTERLLGRRRHIAWNDLQAANRIIQADSGPNTEFINRVGIELIAAHITMKLNQEINGFDAVRARVSAECRLRSLPMLEKDASWEVTKILKNTRLRDLVHSAGWKSSYIERQIEEL